MRKGKNFDRKDTTLGLGRKDTIIVTKDTILERKDTNLERNDTILGRMNLNLCTKDSNH